LGGGKVNSYFNYAPGWHDEEACRRIIAAAQRGRAIRQRLLIAISVSIAAFGYAIA
jgi:hypothetical protein